MFASYAAADGDKLPAERNRKVSRNDCILEVDGVSTKEKRISVRPTFCQIFKTDVQHLHCYDQ